MLLLEGFEEKRQKDVFELRHFLEKQFVEVLFTVFYYCLAKNCLVLGFFFCPYVNVLDRSL